MRDKELKKMASLLRESPDYKVLERLHPPEEYSSPRPSKYHVGCYVDLETTGLVVATNKILEIGLVTFEFTSDGRIYRIIEKYGAFEDPQEPITDEITRLTGITDDMVRGQSIDWAKVRQMIAGAAVIVAHNADFDRKVAERFEPAFKGISWACSMRDINWFSEDITGSKLDYIAFCLGFFYEAHRAVNDCEAGIHVLSHALPISGVPALKAMLDHAREKEYRIWAVGSPFEKKDVLKARGYKWNGEDNGRPRSWYIDVRGEGVAIETKFLHNEIYEQEVELQIDILTAFNRYSGRA